MSKTPLSEASSLPPVPPAASPPVAPPAKPEAEVSKSLAAKAKAKPPLPPEYVGTKTYVLTEKYYNNAEGRMYEPGEKVTVTDTVPGRTWVPA